MPRSKQPATPKKPSRKKRNTDQEKKPVREVEYSRMKPRPKPVVPQEKSELLWAPSTPKSADVREYRRSHNLKGHGFEDPSQPLA